MGFLTYSLSGKSPDAWSPSCATFDPVECRAAVTCLIQVLLKCSETGSAIARKSQNMQRLLVVFHLSTCISILNVVQNPLLNQSVNKNI
jgi:hypothetical protein